MKEFGRKFYEYLNKLITSGKIIRSQEGSNIFERFDDRRIFAFLVDANKIEITSSIDMTEANKKYKVYKTDEAAITALKKFLK